jgi:hypothetical protein
MGTHVAGKFTILTDRKLHTDGSTVGRVRQITGPITRSAVPKRRKGAPDPLMGSTSTYMKASNERDLELIGFENGHLISIDLGGPDISHNIAPMFSYFNQVTYRAIEQKIYAEARLKIIVVSINYREDLPMIPREFTIRAFESEMDFKPFLETIDMAVATPSPFAFAADDDTARLKEIIKQHLPTPKPDAESYGFMDKIRVELGCSPPQEASKYSARQKLCIYIANALYCERETGKAFLRSDQGAEKDPFQTLVRMGGRNRPEVDHFQPKSWNGPNTFANAQLVSKYFNARKLAALEEDDKVALTATRRRSGRLSGSGLGTLY